MFMYVIKLKPRRIVITLLAAAIILCAFWAVRPHRGHDSAAAAANGAESSVALPILMYHGLTENSAKVNSYVIAVSDFEADMKYLAENGYTAVFIHDAAEYVNGDGDMPDKPVAITFDDGFESIYDYAMPIFEKYDMRGTISIVGSYAEKYSDINDKNPEYAYLDYDTIKKMNESGRFEFANHSYDMHMLPNTKGNMSGRKGAAKISGESEDEYRGKLTADAQKTNDLLREKCGIVPTVYTYPYGEIYKQSEQILRDMGFEATLSCFEKTNHISRGNPGCLYSMCRFLRDNKRTAAQILENADNTD